MLKHNNKLLILMVTNHICFIIYNIFYFSYDWLLIGIAWSCVVNIVGNNIGLHRFYSHKSFKTNYNLILDFFSTICCLGSQINYCMVHRHHHQYSDTLKDHQNPKELSFLRSIFMQYNKVQINPKIVLDLLKNKRLKYIHKNYFTIIISYMLLLFIIDINVFIYCFCLPAIVCWWSVISTGTISHLYGYRTTNTKDNSYNNILVSIISMGEGWHNNHHANPSDYRQGKLWWEFDPAARIIEQIKI